jgi:hypothetical protein
MVRELLQDLPAFVGEIVLGKPEDPECREITELFLGNRQHHQPVHLLGVRYEDCHALPA